MAASQQLTANTARVAARAFAWNICRAIVATEPASMRRMSM
jgi:hypothetical protein